MDEGRLHQYGHNLFLTGEISDMRLSAVTLVCLGLTGPAWSADYDKTEKSPLYELRLRVPAEAMAIAPLRAKILALYKVDADRAKRDAKDDKDGNPSFTPYDIDTDWRVTFENGAVISLSAEIDADTGAAYPANGFQTLVWDKTVNRAVPLEALFAREAVKPALTAIADAATRAWTRQYIQRSGQKPGPNADLARDGIGADPQKLQPYILTYAKGETSANGIALLYGAGQVWPHVLGEFRLPVPAKVFGKYLTPQWQAVFGLR